MRRKGTSASLPEKEYDDEPPLGPGSIITVRRMSMRGSQNVAIPASRSAYMSPKTLQSVERLYCETETCVLHVIAPAPYLA